MLLYPRLAFIRRTQRPRAIFDWLALFLSMLLRVEAFYEESADKLSISFRRMIIAADHYSRRRHGFTAAWSMILARRIRKLLYHAEETERWPLSRHSSLYFVVRHIYIASRCTLRHTACDDTASLLIYRRAARRKIAIYDIYGDFYLGFLARELYQTREAPHTSALSGLIFWPLDDLCQSATVAAPPCHASAHLPRLIDYRHAGLSHNVARREACRRYSRMLT